MVLVGGLAEGVTCVKPVGKGISEMKVDYDTDYRVYFERRGTKRTDLICGGTKRKQDADGHSGHSACATRAASGSSPA
jgi:putative addiction module killer protein